MPTHRRRAHARQLHRVLLLSGALTFLTAMFFVPLGRVLGLSLWDGGFTVAGYAKILNSTLYLNSLAWTIELALLTSLWCLILGFPVAYVMVRSGPVLRTVLLTCTVLPLWTSALVRAFALIEILGTEGIINTALLAAGLIEFPVKLLFNRTSVLVGTVQIMLPYMVLSLYAAMLGLDRDLTRAAETLGAGPARAFFLIYVPQTMPGVTSGLLLVFTISLGFYITPAILGGPGVQPFVILVERSMNQLLDWNLAACLSVLLFSTTLLLYVVLGRYLGLAADPKETRRSGIVGAHRLVTLLDRALRPIRQLGRRAFGDGAARRWQLNLVKPVALVIAASVAVPILLIVVIAFSASEVVTFPPEALSLRWFEMYFARPEWVEATVNSFKIAALTACVTTLLVVPAALGMRQLSGAARALTLGLFLSPIVVPNVVFGVAAYLHLATFDLVGTVIGLVLGHTVLAIAHAIPVVFAAVQSLDERLEHAAASLGASAWQRFRHVILPLMAPSAAACALVAFVTSFEDLGVALFLTSGDVMTLPRKMYDSIQIDVDPRVTAASALVIGISLVLLGCFQAIRRRGAAAGSA